MSQLENIAMIEAYWRIVHRIVEQFRYALRSNLTWTHLRQLMRIDNLDARNWYMNEASQQGWSARALDRQIATLYYERLLSSQDKAALRQEASSLIAAQTPADPRDFIRDPYILEFIGAQPGATLFESELETGLIQQLQAFLLELGKGFTFVGRQYRITVNNEHYRVDLVFYHRILRCFVLIDLKIGDVQHHDIGQMNMYLGYFAREENQPDDNPPIGIILSRHKDELLVEYATYQMNSQLFVQKYQLYLPDRDELRRELEQTLREAEA